MKVDLHTHTTASDGIDPPEQVVNRAFERGIHTIAITDHDTTDGIEEALKAAESMDGMEVIPGIEISTLYNGQDIHILGYFIDYKDNIFQEKLKELQEVRKKRNIMMVEKLKELGIEITLEEVNKRKKHKGGNIGRPHMAEVMIEKGYVSSLREAMDKYLGRGKKAYVTPPRISPFEAVDIIKQAKGVPIVAHPGLYNDPDLILKLINYGIAGIEVYHSDHEKEVEDLYLKMAEDHNVLKTSGSDYHGERNGQIFHGEIGNRYTDSETVKLLKVLADKNR
jgi:3',5'-nucleoside bisphosphate phosphatase